MLIDFQNLIMVKDFYNVDVSNSQDGIIFHKKFPFT